ncbi:MAG: FhaA domain-containing protein [Mobiluncus porci]|uniref:FhaA domain-containing protein n=1 Tax=Mobiluncus porci TaxID=2652278 RepID=UPI0023F1F317|nr:FhaA domain-containing protein [Mobiluncus porci]MDD7541103.1 DUF3662 domain-containing protein [Mobiluncus porci]MDY5747562.1 FhaA domain-containing protein [Mobiluncus porci]
MELFDRVLAKVRQPGVDKPIDITQAIRQEMDKKAIPMSRERTVAPNRFQVFLTPETDAAFEEWGKAALEAEFIRDAQAYAEEQHYSLVGSVQIELLAAEPGARRTEVRSHTIQSAQTVAPPENNVPSGQKKRDDSVTSGPEISPSFRPVSSAAATNRSNADKVLDENQDKPLLEVVGGQTYLLVGDKTVVGRGKNVDISLEDTSVSHQHFEIVRMGTHYVLHDLGSTNGTFVEGNKVAEATLLDRNILTAGRVKMIFWRQAAEEGSDQ